jgi:hypothetical protein
MSGPRSALLAIALLAAVTAACRREGISWERPEPDGRSGTEGLLRDGDGGAYFQRGRRTLRFACRGRTLGMTSSLAGSGCLDVQFWSSARGAMLLRVRRGDGAELPARRFALRRGFNSICAELDLRRRDRLRLEADVEGVFSRPLLYRLLPAGQRRCVILISADNLGADHLDLYGYGRSTAPAIAAFRREAVMFRWAFAGSPWTLPSHMSLFTALGENEHGVRLRVTNEEQAAAGKGPAQSLCFPLGLDKEFLVERLSRGFVACAFTGGINVEAAFGFYRGFDDYSVAANDPFARDSAARLFAGAARHLSRHRFPDSFYFLHTYQVHLPFRPPRDLLPGDGGRREFDFARDIGGIAGVFRRGDARLAVEAAALYDGEIREFDRRFGDFLAFLKRAGLYDRAMIILLSDHGEEFFEHGSWAHGTDLFNSQVRVPLLVKFPAGRFAGRSVDRPVSLTDVLPTVLDDQGLELPPALRERSLLAELRGAARPRPVLCTNLDGRNWSRIPPQAAWIEDGFKLIGHWPAPSGGTFFAAPPPAFPPWQLFRLDTDPRELRDLAGELPQVALRLRRRLQRELASHGSPSAEHARAMPRNSLEELRSLGYIP